LNLQSYLSGKIELVNRGLKELLHGEEEYPQNLHRAMHYSLFAGGKRIRPALVLASSEAVGGSADEALNTACAFECIHTYSLIHDDLPAIDNDDMRRGRPTCHKAFGEAAAILVAAQDAAWGPIQQEGKLHDRASYRYYWELLQRAQATGMDIPADARQRFFPEPA